MRLGIEIGGTKLQLGLGEGEELIALRRAPIDAAAGAPAILEQIEAVIAEWRASHEIERVGVGFGGPVDRRRGVVTTSHQVAGWDQFPLAQWLRDRCDAPVVLGNDCDCAALAEATRGAGRGAATVFYVTVGTGVGGGMVIDGRLAGAGRPAIAEIGHLRPGLDAVLPGQTVESLASGRGIEAAMRRRLESAEQRARWPAEVEQLLADCGGDARRLTGKHIGERAIGGDGLCRAVLTDALTVLGWAIAQVVTLVAPNVVVVGGGVSLIGEEHFFAPLRQRAAEFVFPPLADSFEIRPAELGEETVVHGALALASEPDSDEPLPKGAATTPPGQRI